MPAVRRFNDDARRLLPDSVVRAWAGEDEAAGGLTI